LRPKRVRRTGSRDRPKLLEKRFRRRSATNATELLDISARRRQTFRMTSCGRLHRRPDRRESANSRPKNIQRLAAAIRGWAKALSSRRCKGIRRRFRYRKHRGEVRSWRRRAVFLPCVLIGRGGFLPPKAPGSRQSRVQRVPGFNFSRGRRIVPMGEKHRWRGLSISLCGKGKRYSKRTPGVCSFLQTGPGCS